MAIIPQVNTLTFSTGEKTCCTKKVPCRFYRVRCMGPFCALYDKDLDYDYDCGEKYQALRCTECLNEFAYN